MQPYFLKLARREFQNKTKKKFFFFGNSYTHSCDIYRQKDRKNVCVPLYTQQTKKQKKNVCVASTRKNFQCAKPNFVSFRARICLSAANVRSQQRECWKKKTQNSLHTENEKNMQREAHSYFKMCVCVLVCQAAALRKNFVFITKQQLRGWWNVKKRKHSEKTTKQSRILGRVF